MGDIESNEQKVSVELDERLTEAAPAGSVPTEESHIGVPCEPVVESSWSRNTSEASANGVNDGKLESEPSYIYAIGKIEPRFPSISIEKEFSQATGRSDTKGIIDLQMFHDVLTKPENEYLLRKLCWVMTIDGLDTYILKPVGGWNYKLLAESIPSGTKSSTRYLDAVIGVKGPIAPPEMCNGLQLPIASFDQIYSFEHEALLSTIKRPENITKEAFKPASEDLLDRVLDMTDNAGATDEHRAINYLAMRYSPIYSLVADQQVSKNARFAGVEAHPSRLSGARKIMSVIFSFINRTTDVTEKFFVRVDVTGEFPFLVSKLAPYYER
jgi:hypothetical protein